LVFILQLSTNFFIHSHTQSQLATTSWCMSLKSLRLTLHHSTRTWASPTVGYPVGTAKHHRRSTSISAYHLDVCGTQMRILQIPVYQHFVMTYSCTYGDLQIMVTRWHEATLLFESTKQFVIWIHSSGEMTGTSLKTLDLVNTLCIFTTC